MAPAGLLLRNEHAERSFMTALASAEIHAYCMLTLSLFGLKYFLLPKFLFFLLILKEIKTFLYFRPQAPCLPE